LLLLLLPLLLSRVSRRRLHQNRPS